MEPADQPPKRKRGRPTGTTKGPSAPTKKLAAHKEKKRAKMGRKTNAEKAAARPKAQQLAIAELVETGKGFGEAEYKRRREEEARQREEEAAGGADGQFRIPYPFTAGRKPLLEFNEFTLTRIWQAGTCRCTQAETAATLGVSEKTLQRFFLEHPAAREVFEDAALVANGSLRSYVHSQAMAGNTPVLLRCMEHWLGMSHKDKGDDPTEAMKEVMAQVADRFRSKYLAQLDEAGTVEVHSDPV